MPTGLLSGLPVEHYVPWSFLFATALLATAVDAFSRRLFNPVVMCVWFFGLAFCGSVGGWGVTELAAGAICLVTPHLLICSFSGRGSSVVVGEDVTSQPNADHPEVHPPIPLSDPSKSEPDQDQGFRRVA